MQINKKIGYARRALRIAFTTAFTTVVIWVVVAILIRVYPALDLQTFIFLSIICVAGCFMVLKDDLDAAFMWALRKWLESDQRKVQ